MSFAAPGRAVERTGADLTARIGALLDSQPLEPAAVVELGGGVQASTLVLRHTSWQVKNPPQSGKLTKQAWQAWMRLPEAERLKHMNRYRDHVQIWWVDLKGNAGADGKLKEHLKPARNSHRWHREPAFIGRAGLVRLHADLPMGARPTEAVDGRRGGSL